METREGVDETEVGGDDTSREGFKAGDEEVGFSDQELGEKVLKNVRSWILFILKAVIRL